MWEFLFDVLGASHPRLGDSCWRVLIGSWARPAGGCGPRLAEAVRSEIARSLPVTPCSVRSPIERPDQQRSGHTQSRRRLHYWSQSSDGDYSGGDSPRGSSQRHPRRGTTRHSPLPRRHRSAQRSAGLVRVVPNKVTVNNPHYRDLFDCETYSLENRSVSYTREHAHMMGRLEKDVMHSFGHRSE